MSNKFSVYADGSSGGGSNGPCGWGWVILMDGEVLCAGNGGLPVGTNNLAELMGAREGLRALLTHPSFQACRGKIYSIELVSDSQYVLGLANGNFAATKNVALAQHVRALCVQAIVATRWVKGHAGDPINEICDKLAKAGKDVYRPNKKSRGTKRKERRRKVKELANGKKE